MNAFSSTRIFLTAVTMLFASQAIASQRVLIRFDETGHHLHRVVAIAAKNFVPQSDSKDAVLAGAEQQRYAMQVQWFDSSGYLLATDYQADPRVSHTPSKQRYTKPTFVRLLNGAYVVTGPAQGTLIQISLPDRFDVGLAAETWQVYLPQ
jgi:hypothetical protein